MTEPQPTTGKAPRWSFLSSGALLAVITYLVAVPVGFLLVRYLHLNPLTVRGATMPVIIGTVGFAAVLLATRRRWRGERFVEALSGVLAGLYAGWLALIAKAALYGTPHGFGGLEGDTKRIVAMAAQYTTTWQSTDTFTKDMPGEYPPLFPWTIGRVAVLTGGEPWRLMATAQILTLSGAVLLAFLLWRRLVASPVALGLAVVSLLPFHDASKSYEIAVLVVLIPWILSCFAAPPRGRLHWLAGGLIGGLIVLTYQGFFVFVLIGLLAIMWRTWRAAPRRRAYLGHLAGVAVTAFVLASWYLIPYLYASATRPAYFVADTYQATVLGENPVPLPFLQLSLFGLICLVGLVGLIWYAAGPVADRTWWAWPLSALLLGGYAFIALASLRWAFSGHNMFVHYAVRVVTIVLVSAAVLTLAELWARLPERDWVPRVRSVALVVFLAVAVSGTLDVWRAWSPTLIGGRSNPTVDLAAKLNPADLAHVEPLPGGRLPKFAPAAAEATRLPMPQIKREVEARYGAGYRPVVLTVDERVFSYEPWYCYVNPWSTSAPTLSDWLTRHAAVRDLARTTDPAAFAAADEALPYGGIEVFLLSTRGTSGTDELLWLGGPIFHRAQFAPASFDVIDLPNDYALVIRKP